MFGFLGNRGENVNSFDVGGQLVIVIKTRFAVALPFVQIPEATREPSISIVRTRFS